MRRALNHGYVEISARDTIRFDSLQPQVLRHFQTDEPTSHNDDPLCIPRFDPRLDLLTVWDISQRKHSGRIHSLDWW